MLVIYILVMWIFDLKHRWNLKYLGDYNIVRGILFLLPVWLIVRPSSRDHSRL